MGYFIVVTVMIVLTALLIVFFGIQKTIFAAFGMIAIYALYTYLGGNTK